MHCIRWTCLTATARLTPKSPRLQIAAIEWWFTKDRDFRDSHLLTRSPRRLLVVATGNITNDALLALFAKHLDVIVAALDEGDFVEFGPDVLIVHRRHGDEPPG